MVAGQLASWMSNCQWTHYTQHSITILRVASNLCLLSTSTFVRYLLIMAASLLLPACTYIFDVTTAIDEQSRSTGRQNITTALTKLPQGWVLARKHQCTTAITTMWTESSWAFPESYTADDSWIMHSSNGDQRKTKALRTPQLHEASFCTLYVWVNAWRQSRWCSLNLRRPFLRAGRLN